MQDKPRERIIKQLLVDCDITYGVLVDAVGVSKPTLSRVINGKFQGDGEYWPTAREKFVNAVEAYLTKHPGAVTWLKKHALEVGDVWDPAGRNIGRAFFPGTSKRRLESRRTLAIVPGDPNQINQDNDEEVVEMLTHRARQHFRLIRTPFMGDIRDQGDIYLSEDHRYIEAAMIDAAQHGGFIAVIGEVGCGKSVMRKKVVAALRLDENARIIFPRIIDKSRITAASICDAIIMDLSDQGPRMRLEAKSRQVEKLLLARAQAECHVALIIEEAHDLPPRVLKLLKRFHEIEVDGYRKAMGIILIGQPELGAMFNEGDHYDMREVIRRCQVAEIGGLNGNIGAYLDHKFKRVGATRKKVITDGAVKALGERLTRRDDRGKKVSHAYPLTVNNLVTRAMNDAAEIGEKLVTEEVINGL